MAVYTIAQMKFTDRVAYDRYQSRFMGVFKKFNGRVLAADEKPLVLEGKWDWQKIVILEFPDAESAHRFSESQEYKEIAVDRIRGTESVVLLVHGFSSGR